MLHTHLPDSPACLYPVLCSHARLGQTIPLTGPPRPLPQLRLGSLCEPSRPKPSQAARHREEIAGPGTAGAYRKPAAALVSLSSTAAAAAAPAQGPWPMGSPPLQARRSAIASGPRACHNARTRHCSQQAQNALLLSAFTTTSLRRVDPSCSQIREGQVNRSHSRNARGEPKGQRTSWRPPAIRACHWHSAS